MVTRYRIALEQHPYAPSTINLRLAALRRLAYEASDCGLLSPDLAAGIRRVKGVRRLGVRVGNWLTAQEGKKLLGAESATPFEADEIALCSRFTPKTFQCLAVLGKVFREEFERNKSVEARVLRLVDYTHATAAELFHYAVVRDGLADERVGF